ncbi:hypothetical protein J6590_003361 [Homalodisca vitripennis]|nr:hypothetical protein J6590_003361 [Homalodisca vitripennis]
MIRQSLRSLWNRPNKSNVHTPVSFDLNVINDYFVNLPIDESAARDYVAELRTANRFSFVPLSEVDVFAAFSRLTSKPVSDTSTLSEGYLTNHTAYYSIPPPPPYQIKEVWFLR